MKRFLTTLAFRRPYEPLAVIDVSSQMIRRSAQGTLIIAIAQFAKFIIQFASQIILARLLLPRDFGLIAMIFPIVGVVQIFNDVGLSQILIIRDHLDRALVSSLFWLNLLVGFVIGSVVIALAPAAAWLFGDQRLLLLMVATAIGIPLSSIGAHPHCLLVRQMRFGASAGISVIATAASLVATVAAAWAGFGYWSLVVGQYALTITSNILAWYASGWTPSAPRIDRASLAGLSFGGSITGANVANYITTAGDNGIIAYSYGSSALGLYDRSYRLVVQPIGQLIAPISTTAAPLLARMRQDRVRYQDTYLAILQIVVLLTVPGMVTCAIFPEQVLATLLGERWIPAARIFAWISVGGLFSAIYSSATWLFLSQERVGEMMRTTLAASVINILAYLAGSHYGTAGVAAAGALSFLFINTPLTFFVALRSGPVRMSAVTGVLAFQYGFVGISVLALLALRTTFVMQPYLLIGLGLLISYTISAAATFSSADQRARLIRTITFVWRSRK